MLTKEQVIDYCLSLEGAFKRYPFGPAPLVMSIPPKKGFCDIYEDSIPLHIVLKAIPEEAEFLREEFSSIKPGYHCNKRHWNSVFLDGSIPDDVVLKMIRQSYDLVKKDS
jgi:predicted DNA-binding protein (MmcQ/YjbR family)